MAVAGRPPISLVNPDTARLPPHNLEAEMSLLGAILVNNRALEICEDFLEPEHFADYVHARVYDAMRTMIRRGSQANAATLRLLMTEPAFHAVGGPDYLSRLADCAVTIVGVAEYARIILDMAARRRVIDVAAQAIEEAHADDLDRTGWSLAEKTAGAFDEAAQMRPKWQATTRSFAAAMKQAIAETEDAYRRDGALAGKPTGVRGLDNFLGGLFDTDLTMIGGRSGQGKTVLGITIALACARAGIGVAFFTLEMSHSQIAQRVLAQETGISVERQRKGWVRAHEWPLLKRAEEALGSIPIHFEEDGGQTVETIRARARKLKFRHGAGIVIIDHLQRIAWSPGFRTDREAIGHITGEAKTMAKALGVPVVLLSQLTRDVDKRDSPRPTKADLFGSGMIEADADNILLLWRPGFYAAKKASEHGQGHGRTKDALAAEQADAAAVADDTAEIIVGKNRHGTEGAISVGWDGPRMRFIERDEPDAPEGLFDRG